MADADIWSRNIGVLGAPPFQPELDLISQLAHDLTVWTPDAIVRRADELMREDANRTSRRLTRHWRQFLPTKVRVRRGRKGNWLVVDARLKARDPRVLVFETFDVAIAESDRLARTGTVRPGVMVGMHVDPPTNVPGLIPHYLQERHA